MSRWQQTAAGPRLFYGPPTISDAVTAIRKALDYLQQNNPILMDDRDQFREKTKKALDRAAKIASMAEQVAAGHAYDKHVVEQDECPWVKNREDFRELIPRILRNPTE